MEQEQKPLSLGKLSILIDEKKPLCLCGKPLEGTGVDYWGPHDGGIYIVGEKEKQWVFVHCNHCGYEMALWKIVRELQ
jgi:hypothetical protein